MSVLPRRLSRKPTRPSVARRALADQIAECAADASVLADLICAAVDTQAYRQRDALNLELARVCNKAASLAAQYRTIKDAELRAR